MIKITKDCGHRVNFEMDGFHYSINQFEGDCGECACAITRKEDREFITGFGMESELWEVLRPYVKAERSKGLTYKQRFDLKGLETFLRKIIEEG